MMDQTDPPCAVNAIRSNWLKWMAYTLDALFLKHEIKDIEWFNLLKFPLTLGSAFYFQHLLKLQDNVSVSQQQSGLCTGKMHRDNYCP